MGADPAVKDEVVRGAVVELMPNATVRVKLENHQFVLAHLAGATSANFLRLRPGDPVEVVVFAHDRTRGRVRKLLEKER